MQKIVIVNADTMTTETATTTTFDKGDAHRILRQAERDTSTTHELLTQQRQQELDTQRI